MTVWYTADPHWGHQFVASLRGFDDPTDHDAWLDGVYTNTFLPGDVIWWLGDLTMRMRPIEAADLTTNTAMFAHHRLIYGNHDAGHPMHRAAHRHQQAYRGFELAAPFAKRRLPGVGETLLSHFPYTGDHTDDERYTQWRLPDLGVPLIHGHTHGTEKVTRTPNGTLQVHVGIDAWGRPVAEHEIVQLLHQHQGVAA